MFGKLQEQVFDHLPRIASGVIFSAVVAGISTSSIAPAYADVQVVADQAKVFRLDEPAETIILGNPSIADVTVHDRLTIVITGKSYGTTNLVVLNDASEPVVEELITVTAEMAGYVAVQRNNSRFTYSCNPDCQEVLRLGDDKKKMEDVSSSISLRNELAENGIVANNNN